MRVDRTAGCLLLAVFPVCASAGETEAPAVPAPEVNLIQWSSPLAMALAQVKATTATSTGTTGPSAWHLFAETGVSGNDVDGKLSGRFQQNREVPRGFFLRALDLSYVDKDSPFLGSLRASEIRERDQRITADIWRVGTFRTQISWDEIPDFISNSRSLYTQTGRGNLSVSPSIRANLETLLGGPTASPQPQNVPQAFQDAIRREISVAPRLEIGTRRESGFLRQSWSPSDAVEIHFVAGQTRKHGNIPFGTGTFARQNTIPVPAPYTPNDGVWEALGQELPAPIDWRTNEFGGGLRFSGKIWQVGADYNYEQFRDPVTGLTYDNWFRVTDAAGNPQGSALGRERFARSAVAYPPSSETHSVVLRAGLDLPRENQLRAVLAYGRTSQNDAFLPYTLNTALQGVIGGTYTGLATNIPAGTLVYDVNSLPQKSLNGNVETINQDYSFVTRSIPTMTFRLQYRVEDLDNNSPIITFPGFARFGESQWVTSLDYYGVPIHNRPESYVKQDGIATMRWDIAKPLALTLGYQYEGWDRTHRNVLHSNEHTARVRLDFTPSSMFSFRADYRYGERKPDQYLVQPLVFNPALNVNPPSAALPGPGGPGWEDLRGPGGGPLTPLNGDISLEFNQLRKFDIGPRKRHDGIGTVDVRLGQMASFSGSFRYVKNDYLKIPATPKPNYSDLLYGALYDESWDASAEFSVTPGERSVFFVTYTREQNRYGFLSIGNLITGSVASPNPNVDPCCSQYPIQNSWERRNKTTLDSVQVGGNYATPGDGWVFDASYALSFATEKTNTTNPFPPIVPNSPRTAVVYPYPDVTDRFQELLVSVTRRFSKSIELGVRYRYEVYRTDDFYLNDISPYAQGQVRVGGVVTNIPRYLFLNARYGSYTANELSGFLRYRY